MHFELPPARTISGAVEADGKGKGRGFTVSHEFTGVYVVRFNEPFSTIFEPSYTFKLEIIDFINYGGSNANGAFLINGNYADLKKATTVGFKYFTYVVEENTMYMKDMAVRFSATGFDEENDKDKDD